MKSRTGTKRNPQHAGNGRFKVVPSFSRVHAEELRQRSVAQMGARLDAAEKTFKRATHGAASLMRGTMNDAAEAGAVVRSSMKEAFVAVRRATRRIAHRMSTAARAVAPAAKPVKRAPRAPAAKRVHRAAA
jgi:hypothetical protein